MELTRRLRGRNGSFVLGEEKKEMVFVLGTLRFDYPGSKEVIDPVLVFLTYS